MIRIEAVDAFTEAGFFVLEADDAAAALSTFDTMNVALLFTDINMPGELDGIELAERLIISTPGLPIIITSGLPILRPSGHLGAQFVSKPYNAVDVGTAAFALLAAEFSVEPRRPQATPNRPWRRPLPG